MMKIFKYLLPLVITTSVFADAVIFSGANVKALKQNLDLFGVAQILSGSVDPSAVATTANKGSIYLNNSSANIYRKTDNGSTTNWVLISSAGTGDVVGPASSTDTALARFDGATGKLLQNSSATLDDFGFLTVDTAEIANGLGILSGGLSVLGGASVDANSVAVPQALVVTKSETSPASSIQSLNLSTTLTGPSSQSAYGAFVSVTTAGSSNITGESFGGAFSAGTSGSANRNFVTGISAVSAPGGTSNVSQATGLKAIVDHEGSGTITNAYSMRAKAPLNNGGGTITNAYSMYVEDATGIGGTISRSLNVVGGDSFFGGRVLFGTAAAVDANGGFSPASMADGTANNNTLYFSTTASKLVYKDAGGVVHDLY